MARGDRSTERTSEERERDRIERERRRAARGGGSAPAQHAQAEPIEHDAPSPAAEAQPAAEPQPAGGLLPVEMTPDLELPPTVESPVAETPPAPEAQAEPSPGQAHPSDGPAEAGHAAVEYEVPDLPPAPPSPPRIAKPPGIPPRRGSRAMPTRRSRGAAAAGGASAGSGSSRGGRGRTPAARVAAVVALAAVLAAVALVARSLKGSSSPRSVSLPVVVKVLIPEGKTRLQIAQIAAADGLTGDYREAARSSPLLDPVKYGAPKDTPDLEGFLFPATYDMDKGAPVGRLVEEQLTAFRENFGPEDVSRARALHVTPYQLLTVASMVEREAQIPGDRPKIAAVIYNRLRAGMPLGIDATIYYAVETAENIPTYTHELTEAQLHIDSPYNTRLHTGLPPTPISNPGAASIHAAAHPAQVSYLYYVAGADGCGEQVFSDRQSEFETNVAAYEAAKRANGGRPPQCKHHR